MGGDLGEGFDVVGLVAREGEARVMGAGGDVTVEDCGKGFGVGEGVVDAGTVAVLEVVGASVEDVVVGAGGHEFDVAVGRLRGSGGRGRRGGRRPGWQPSLVRLPHQVHL